MTPDRMRRCHAWIPLALMLLPATARLQEPNALQTRAERETFLSTAAVIDAPADGKRMWRATLERDGVTHDASINIEDGSDPTQRNYRFNVAAYELDKLLGLNLALPTVERVVGGQSASVTWWLDEFAMNELDRRRRSLAPPDVEGWERQIQAVRIFDELISNTYRDPSPPLYLNSVWDNLLVTKDWTVWLTDHTGAFRVRRQLQNPDGLLRCPRPVLNSLRKLDGDRLRAVLGRYLSPPQLEALEVRRTLLVKHFEDQIRQRGESAVLYDLAPRP